MKKEKDTRRTQEPISGFLDDQSFSRIFKNSFMDIIWCRYSLNLELVSIHLNLTPLDSIHYPTHITQPAENAKSAAETYVKIRHQFSFSLSLSLQHNTIHLWCSSEIFTFRRLFGFGHGLCFLYFLSDEFVLYLNLIKKKCSTTSANIEANYNNFHQHFHKIYIFATFHY